MNVMVRDQLPRQLIVSNHALVPSSKKFYRARIDSEIRIGSQIVIAGVAMVRDDGSLRLTIPHHDIEVIHEITK